MGDGDDGAILVVALVDGEIGFVEGECGFVNVEERVAGWGEDEVVAGEGAAVD